MNDQSLSLDQWLQLWEAEKTARALGFEMTYTRTADGTLFIMSKDKKKTDSVYKPEASKHKRNRRGGKGGGDGLNVSRRTPYLT